MQMVFLEHSFFRVMEIHSQFSHSKQTYPRPHTKQACQPEDCRQTLTLPTSKMPSLNQFHLGEGREQY